jgi:tetratricopeptide (TPR) repeat protein
MAKPGRNDRCPCGSGKKYKSCCLTRDEAAETERLAAEQAGREKRAAAKRDELRTIREAITANFASSDPLDDAFDDELDVASNAVVDLIHAGRLDDAEAAARELLVRYPDVHDGWDRLGFVHEKRGENRQAAECYRKVVDFLHQNPGYADADLAEHYTKLAAKLDPPVTT